MDLREPEVHCLESDVPRSVMAYPSQATNSLLAALRSERISRFSIFRDRTTPALKVRA